MNHSQLRAWIRGGVGALTTLLCASGAWSQGSRGGTLALEDVEVVVTAARTATDIGRVAAPVTVVTQKQIRALGADTVAQVLRQVPGVVVRTYGARGELSTVGLRGSSAEQVLVLVDGRRLNRAQGGGVDFANLPIDFIERIEVLRGGASAAYGADALGGVINILTRRPDGAAPGQLTVSTGSWGYDRYALETSGEGELGRSTLFVQREQSTGDYDYETAAGQPATRNNASFSGLNVRFNFERDTSDHSQFTFRLERDHARKGVPGTLSFPSTDATQVDDRWVVDFGQRWTLSDRHVLDARLYRNRQAMRYSQPTGFQPYAKHVNWRDALEVRGDLFPSWGQLTYGWDHARSRLSSTNDGARHRTSDGFYALARIPCGRWTLTPGARFDDHTDFGSKLSPQLGAVCPLGKGWRFTTRWAKSFRAPAFDDLYWPEDAFAKGNPNLRPERGTSLDLGIHRQWRSGSAGLSLFSNNIDDLILWQPDATTKWTPQNVSAAKSTGFEAEIAADLGGHWQFGANYTYLDSEDRSGTAGLNGKQLIYRPRHAAALRLTYDRSAWSATLSGAFTGRRFSDAANTTALPSFETLDLVSSIRLGGHTTARLEVRNLLDKSYQNVADYPTPGRELRLSLQRAS